MATQCNSVAPHAIETLTAWVQSGETRIPKIQRPFVQDATKGLQSSGFPPLGISGGLPANRRAQSAGATQGRFQVVWQTYPRRRAPGEGDRADGRPARAKGRGLPGGRYSRIASFVLAQRETDIAIAGNPPERDFTELAELCYGGARKHGGITDPEQMCGKPRRSYLLGSLLHGDVSDYDEFPEQRRVRIERKIQAYFGVL